jgi:hypothetical protein
MTRQEFEELVRFHSVNHLWCYGCGRQVGTLAKHLADVMEEQGVFNSD